MEAYRCAFDFERASRCLGGRALLVLLHPVLLLACGPGSTDVAVSDAPIRLQEVATIGCGECDGVEQLTVFTFARTPAGRIWTLDLYEPLIRGFERDGAPFASFGRKGQGPGEIGIGGADTFIPGLGIYPRDDGSILVHQLQPPGLLHFEADGTYLGTIRIETTRPRVPRAMAYDPERQRIFIASFTLGPDSSVAVHRFDLSQDAPIEPLEILAGLEDLPPDPEDPERVSRSFQIAVAPDGSLTVADPFTYSIATFTPDGQPLSRFGRDLPLPRKSDERLRQEREEAVRRGRPDPAQIPEVLPHFDRSSLGYDDQGRLWVWTQRGDEDETIFDVFAPDGAFLTEVAVDATLKRDAWASFAARGGHLAATVVHESGNDRIRVWRIVP